MKKYLILNVFLSLIFLTSSVFSQKTTEISDEKKAVISELLTVIKADVQTKEIMQAMFAQMESMYPSIIDSLVDKQTDLSSAQKEQVKKEHIERNRNFNSRFNEKFIKMINFEDYMNQVFYPLYDKFFTTAELNDLLAFYKTPTGQKFITATPQLTGESMKLAQAYLLPRIDGLMKEMMDEDLNYIKSNKNPPAPKKKQN
jgi:hypothetical protein